MRWFPFVVLAVLAVLLQTTLLRVAGGSRPDLMIAMLAPFCLGARRADGFAAGCILGLLRDLFSAEPFGLSMGLFALMGYGLAWLRPSVYAEHPVTHAIFGLLCSALASGASLAVVALEGGTLRAGATAWRVAGIALGTALLSAVVGAVAWRWPRWFGLRRGAEYEGVG